MNEKNIWILGGGPIRPLPEGPERTEIEGVLRRAGLAGTLSNEENAMGPTQYGPSKEVRREDEPVKKLAERRPLVAACLDDLDIAIDEVAGIVGQVEERLTPVRTLTMNSGVTSDGLAKPSPVHPPLVMALQTRTIRVRELRDRLINLRESLEV